jgi:nucleotide-binding universal stress UspA family protein
MEHVVVGTDGSPSANRAVEWAAAQLTQLSSGTLTVVHGFRPGIELFAAAVQIDLDPARAEHQRQLETIWSEPARRALTGSDVRVLTEIIENNPAGALVFVAERGPTDAVVIGHEGGHGEGRDHVGTTTARLLHRCPVPLIVVNDATTPGPMAGTAVVALSRPTGTTNPELVWAIETARQFGLALHLVTVVEPVVFIDGAYGIDWTDIIDTMSRQLDTLTKSLAATHPDLSFSAEVAHGPAARALATVADERKATLVVAGSHHPGHFSGFIGGSLSHLAPTLLSCPLVAVPVD